MHQCWIEGMHFIHRAHEMEWWCLISHVYVVRWLHWKYLDGWNVSVPFIVINEMLLLCYACSNTFSKCFVNQSSVSIWKSWILMVHVWCCLHCWNGSTLHSCLCFQRTFSISIKDRPSSLILMGSLLGYLNKYIIRLKMARFQRC